MRQINTGKILSETAKAKLRDIWFSRSPEWHTEREKRRKLAHQTPEIREKIKKALTGKKRPPMSQEQKKKLRAANIGKRLTEQTKEKMRQSHLGKPRGPMPQETKDKISQTKQNKRKP